MRFPIYLLVTKCDLLAGFMDYFGDARQGSARHALGLHLRARRATAEQGLERFGAEFDALAAAPHRRPDRPPAGRARRRSAARASTASRSSSAPCASVLQEFAEQVFSPSHFEAEPAAARRVLRQRHAGGHADRPHARPIARSYKLERAMLRAQPGQRQELLPERGCSARWCSPRAAWPAPTCSWERRRGLLRRWRLTRCWPCSAIGAIGAWGVSYLNNRRYVDEVGSARRSGAQAGAGHAQPRRRPTCGRCVPALDAAQGAGAAAASGDRCPGRSASACTRATSSTARRGRPTSACWSTRCCRAWRCASRSSCAPATAPEPQYEALKAYLMLYEPERFDAAALKRYVEGRLGRPARARARHRTSARA